MQTRQAGLEGTGEIKLRHLVKEALRMLPSRIVVGEVRSEECLDLLLALNSGLPGMATVHANSAREALVKLCTLPLLAGENISARFVVPTVASSVDIVVHVGVEVGGGRRVSEIVAVTGRVEADVIETEPLFLRVDGRLVRVQGMPPRLERFASRGIDVHRLLGQPSSSATRSSSAQPQRFERTPHSGDPHSAAVEGRRRTDEWTNCPHHAPGTASSYAGSGPGPLRPAVD